MAQHSASSRWLSGLGITAPLKDETPGPAPTLDLTTAVAGAAAALGGMVAVPEYRDDPRGRRRSTGAGP